MIVKLCYHFHLEYSRIQTSVSVHLLRDRMGLHLSSIKLLSELA